ncbi:MAG: hypothetical protein KDD02_27155, partial [Phaeodactylibacter sp.]|nr:hypothetical protein [Phaeodactylibacter sp.]
FRLPTSDFRFPTSDFNYPAVRLTAVVDTNVYQEGFLCKFFKEKNKNLLQNQCFGHFVERISK